MQRGSIPTYSLLASVIVIWSLAWPTSKIGLMDMPPLWFTEFRLLSGFLTVFLILLFQKKIKIPKVRDLPLILSIGLLQMACFLLLINGGLLFVGAGRSAILVYSTPFLVTPIAILFFGERLTTYKLLGLLLGFLGVITLFNPWGFDWHNQQIIMGNLLLLLAAACWAIAMIHTRYGTWHSSSLQLVPWQLLLALISVLIVCFIINPHPKINFTPRLLVMGLYNGVLATGFAYAAIIYVSQRLPVITTSLLLLGVPVLGLLFSAWMLGERLTFDIILALILILVGLFFISFDKNNDVHT